MTPRARLASVEMPANVARLPVDERTGFPVPYFVAWIDSVPYFTVADDAKRHTCWKENLCWICGRKNWQKVPNQSGGFVHLPGPWAFVGGPIAFENRRYTDFGSHEDCAVYAARVCPMLSDPEWKYSEHHPPGARRSAGAMGHNPKVVVMPIAGRFVPVRYKDELLFEPADILRVRYFHRGEEIDESAARKIK